MQVASDAVTVGQDAELTHLALRAGQLPSQSGLIGERSHHVELFVVERLRTDGPHRDKDAGDRVGGPKGQYERRAGRGRIAGYQFELVEPTGHALNKRLADQAFLPPESTAPRSPDRHPTSP